MRILIVTYGSLGDLHPAIALARGLHARGHQAAIATSEPYRTKVTGVGLPFLPVRPDLSLTDEALVRRVMDGRRGSQYLMRDLVYPSVRDMHADLAALARNADAMLTSELVCAAPIVAARQRVPWGFFALAPISFFPLHDPPLLPGPPGLHALQALGPAANRLVRRLAKLTSHHWWGGIRSLRRELGLDPGKSPLFEGKFSPDLNLALFSNVLQRPQPDWPANTVQAGFVFHDEDHGSTLPEPVERFLAAGDPPLLFTLGSAAVMLGHDFFVESAQAAQRLGRRAILLLGRNTVPPSLPPSILPWNYLPYAAILPRVAAVIHQGGVGTTAQALRAGRPMLVVPFAHDQFDNAARAVRLGVARCLARSRYDAATAARELTALLDTPAAATKAGALGATIRSENSLAVACDAIERMLHARVAGPAPHRRS